MVVRGMVEDHEVDHFTKEMMEQEDQENPFMLMGFREDELVLLDGLAKMLMDIGLTMGMEPSIEMASLQSRFAEALHQFYGEE